MPYDMGSRLKNISKQPHRQFGLLQEKQAREKALRRRIATKLLAGRGNASGYFNIMQSELN